MERLERTQLIHRPRREVFAFFERAENLEQITPAFLHFSITTPLPIEMKTGARIEYRLRLFGIPIRWRTRIDIYEPDIRFVDLQVRGPYRFWRHLHTFEETPEGTLMRDVVDYEIPLGPLGELAGRLFVRRTLSRIFDYRSRRIAEIFE